MEVTNEDRDRPDPLAEAAVGFVWMFAAGLLILGGGAVVVLAIATHLLIRFEPDVTRVITYDPSNLATLALIPTLAGLALVWLFRRRLGRRWNGVLRRGA